MRVFVGVRIASAIASELTRLARDLEQFPVRLVAMGDVHLTLVPPWNESSILEATDKIGSVAGGFCGFTLGFRHLGYGPNPERPRLLWAQCDATSDLTALRAALLQACGRTEERAFSPAGKWTYDRDAVSNQSRNIIHTAGRFHRTLPLAAFRRCWISNPRFAAAGRRAGFA
jgi:2'-5' RNA ligase